MAYNPEMVLGIVKARLNRLASDMTMDTHFMQRIDAAEKELERTGITLSLNDVRDQVFLADYVAWQHQNRDKPGGMPEWLRLARRERWLQKKGDADDP